jgi:hypothetical protein
MAPATWKYYLNISGEYHPTDIRMSVISLDTLEEVSFDKTTLADHTNTKDAYRFGTRYYYSLVSKYPNQEQLILGILYPADLNKAVTADEGSILAYPAELIEPQEISLLYDLELFIKNYLVRWNVQAFGISDSLYNTSYHALLYLNLLPKLLNLRLQRCKTYEVHTFHIRQYLASNNGLDRFLPYMTLKQALYLYRNINYIERNAGSVEQFKELVQKVLTDRHIPLSEYSVRHLNKFDAAYYPEVTSRKKPVNDQYNIPEKDYIDLELLYTKEEKLATGNIDYYLNKKINDTYRFKNSTSSVVQTKDLESNMIDYTDAVPDPLEKVLIREWISLANANKYNVYITFRDPKTGVATSLYALDAFIYMYYISLKASGIDVVEMPKYFNAKSRKIIKPTVTEMLTVTDSQFKDLKDIAADILSRQPNKTSCVSTTVFNKYAYKIYEESLGHWFITSKTEDLYKRANVANMILQLYEDQIVTFNTEHETMSSWLSANNLPEYNYDIVQAQELIKNIYTGSTGFLIDDTKVLKNIQRAMVSILTELSSYSIQIIKEINKSKIKPLNWAAIRVGNIKTRMSDTRQVRNNIYVLTHRGRSKYSTKIRTDNSKLLHTYRSRVKLNFKYNLNEMTTTGSRIKMQSNIVFKTFRVKVDYPLYDSSISDAASYVGSEYYLALSDVQKNQLKSIY